MMLYNIFRIRVRHMSTDDWHDAFATKHKKHVFKLSFEKWHRYNTCPPNYTQHFQRAFEIWGMCTNLSPTLMVDFQREFEKHDTMYDFSNSSSKFAIRRVTLTYASPIFPTRVRNIPHISNQRPKYTPWLGWCILHQILFFEGERDFQSIV